MVSSLGSICFYRTAPLTDYKSPRLTVSILGHIFSRIIVDGGSRINMMPEFTILALGLQPTHPAPFTVTLADQRTVYPVGIVEKVPLKVQEFTFNLDFVVVSLPQVERGFPLLIGRPWLRHTKALHDWGNDAMWIHTPDSPMQPIRLEGGMDSVVHHSSLSVQSRPNLERPTPPDGFDEDLLQWLEATTSMPCYVVPIQALPEDTPSFSAPQAEENNASHSKASVSATDDHASSVSLMEAVGLGEPITYHRIHLSHIIEGERNLLCKISSTFHLFP
ncbi:hypothetical protein L7F22_022431 [Adiantum nelumboides]|nr:hypothetical protein [Adiantum nelumboides]